jgi:cytochrome b pre-mRNA-processing protein 3
MKDMHTQHRGAILSMDEALAISARGETDHEKLGKADAILAAALWRNIWGAGGWGQGVGGVKRKVKGVDRPDEKKANNKASSEAEEEEGLPELAQDTGIEISGRGAYAIAAAQEKAQQRGFTPQSVEAKSETLLPAHDLEFAVSLEKLVTYIRRELVRLGELSDEEIESGIVAGSAKGEVKDEFDLIRKSQSAASFGKISE